ncbi:MAG: TIGR04372 family glycosyltransferase [SAR202 cluster bacterium]|nr:TIGR04372 family glycosyltransferase [SAR202 cluster bacterium]
MQIPNGIASRIKQEYNFLRLSDRQGLFLRFTRGYFPKLKFLLLIPFLLTLSVCLRVVLLALKPFVHIRFGRILGFQMGNHAMSMELYLCERDSGWHPRRAFDVFYHYNREVFNRALVNRGKSKDQVANKYLDLMMNRHVRVSEFAHTLDNLNRLLRWGSEQFYINGSPPMDQYGLLNQLPPHLVFSDEEEEMGRQALSEMGLDPDSPFVCFSARDGVWLRHAHPRITSAYGDWTLAELRNASIENYLPAAETLTGLGYSAIRTGKFVAAPIDCPNSQVIDYATKHQSDFMDLYLAAKCSFYIAQANGVATLPLIFRRPVALTNIYTLAELKNCTNEKNICLPKLNYSHEKGRLLTFRETMDLNLGGAYEFAGLKPEVLQQMGVEIVENTPDEIDALALEMHHSLRGEFETTKEDDELHARLVSLVHSYPEFIHIEGGLDVHFKMCSYFLRKHPEWLD